MVQCLLCDKTLEPDDVGVFSLEEVANTIQKLLEGISPDYVMVVSSTDELCQKCSDLISRITRLEGELRTANLALRAFLRLKYSLDFTGQPQTQQACNEENRHNETHSENRREVPNERVKENTKPLQKHKMTQTLKLSKSLQCDCWESIEVVPLQKDRTTQTSTSESIHMMETIDTMDTYERIIVPFSKINNSQKCTDESMCVSQNDEEEVSCDEQYITDLEVEQSEEMSNDDVCDENAELACFLDETEVAEDEIGCENSDGHYQSSNDKASLKRLFSCGMCIFTTKSIRTMKAHFLNFKHKEGYYCSICDFGFHKKYTYKIHKAKHSDTNQNKFCAYCKKVIYDRLHLRYHYKLVHSKVGIFVCSLCNKVFGFSRVLRRHRALVHKITKRFKCEKCNAEFYEKVKLMKHREYAHRKSLDCLYCEKPFTTIDKLSHHEYKIHNHYKSEKYQCSFCPKTFPRQEFITEHEKQHTEEFEFRCDICNFGYHEESLLKAHRNSHKPKKRRHYPQRIRQSRLWMCEICGKVIANYPKHRKIHDDPLHGGPFQCPTCPKMFQYKKNWIIHVERFHSTTESDQNNTNDDLELESDMVFEKEEVTEVVLGENNLEIVEIDHNNSGVFKEEELESEVVFEEVVLGENYQIVEIDNNTDFYIEEELGSEVVFEEEKAEVVLGGNDHQTIEIDHNDTNAKSKGQEGQVVFEGREAEVVWEENGSLNNDMYTVI